MSDLADRISRGAVAALDLAPFDDRYGRLSRQVLAGGASRFTRVIADDQTVHFVIPVGLAGERIDYGALVLQDRQAGILWRDASGIDHSAVVPRGDATRTAFSPLTLGGEQWLRFDLVNEGRELAFLVPPVSSPLLRSTLIDFFRARPGAHPPHSPMVAPDPEPVAVRFPDPDPDAETQTNLEIDTQTDLEATQLVAEPVADADALEADAPSAPTPEAPEAPADPDSTQMLSAADAPVPPLSGGEPHADNTSPQDHFAVDPAMRSEHTPADAPTQVSADAPTQVSADAPTQVAAAPPYALYRDQPAQAPAWEHDQTRAMPPQPTPVNHPTPPPSAAVRTVQPAAAAHAAQPSGASRTVIGFLLGLFATLAIGGAVIIAQLLGA